MKKGKIKIAELCCMNLHGIKYGLKEDRLTKYLKMFLKNEEILPIDICVKGQDYFILDGHHRSSAYMLAGYEKILGNIWENPEEIKIPIIKF